MKKIKLMMAALALLGATSVMAQESGNYYLYDSASKTFLSRGDNWGTRASLDKGGCPFKWNTETKKITFMDLDLGRNGVGGSYLKADGSQAWTDNGDGTEWEFEATEGGYYLKDKDGRYSAANGTPQYPSQYTVSFGFADSKENATVWTLMTPAEYKAHRANDAAANYANVITASGIEGLTPENFLETLSTYYAQKDVTDSLHIESFNDNNVWAWTSQKKSNLTRNAIEVYQGHGFLTRNLTGLPKGLYKVTMFGFDRATSNANCVSLGDQGIEITTAYLKANNEMVPLKSWYSGQTNGNNPNSVSEGKAKFAEGKYKNELYVYVGEDGVLDLSVGIQAYGAATRWVLFNNFSLTYYTDQVSEEDAAELLASVPTGKMNVADAAALTAAKAAFEANKTIVNYNALSEAIKTAKASVEAYAKAAAAIARAEDFFTNNTFATAEAIETFATTLDQLKEGYEAETLTTAEASNALNTLAVGVANWHSDSGIAGDLMASAWEAPKNGWDHGFKYYVNNWSVEGETDGTNFTVPYIEAWVGSNSLPVDTLRATLGGFEPNTDCTVTLWSRVETASADAPVAGTIMMSINDGESVDIAAGTKHGETKMYLGNFTAQGKTDANGNINLAINIAEGSNVHWLAFKNVTYTVTLPQPVAAETMVNFNDSAYAMSSNSSNDGDILETKVITNPEVTIEISPKVSGSNPNRFWNVSGKPQLRIYNGTLTIKAAKGKYLDKITFDVDKSKWSGITPDSGTLEDVEWTGNAETVVFTLTSQCRINAIAIGNYSYPVANIAEALAKKEGTLIKLALNNTAVTLYGGKAYTQYSYIQDETGAISLDHNLNNLEVLNENVLLNGALYATVAKNSFGQTELALSEKTGISEITATPGTIEPVATTIADIMAKPEAHYYKYVQLTDVEVFSVYNEDIGTDYTYLVGTDNEGKKDTLFIWDQYNTFKNENMVPDFCKFDTISGFVTIDQWEECLVFNPYGKYVGVETPAAPVANIGALKDIDNDTMVELTLTNAKVTVYEESGRGGLTVIIEDATGAIKLATDPWGYAPDLVSVMGIDGDSIELNGTLTCQYFNQFGGEYLEINDKTNGETVSLTKGVELTPTVLTLAELADKMQRYNLCLVKVEQPNSITMDEDYTAWMTQGEQTIAFYDMFNKLELDEDYNLVVPEKIASVIGLPLYFEDEGEPLSYFIPMSIEASVPNNVNGVNGKVETLNGDVFTVNGVKVRNAGESLKNLKKGVYIINNKKVVVK